MDNFLTELGIKHEVTNSYTPEMNGVAERFNLTALDGIKTLLKSSEVPHKFWGEALLCFTYAWNRICHKDGNKTPFEKYSGRKPSVLHLKPFGCLAYAVSKTSTETPSTSEKPDVSSDNHSLIPCTEVKWIRNIGRKVTGSNVYYSIEGETTRLKSFNEIERYCKRRNIEYDPSLFNFRKDNTESQGFSDLSEQQEALMVEVTIPICYKQAIRSRDASKWRDAMDKEINVMMERKVWDLVDHPDNIKILENRWVYTIKYDENNKIVRYKARLVVRGNTQLRGESFDEVFQEYQLELSKVKSLKLRCYSDSDFATNRDDRVSMGGFITFIDETPISWRTFKQKSVSLSTMEAEGVLPQNWGETKPNRTVTCMVLKTAANIRRNTSPLPRWKICSPQFDYTVDQGILDPVLYSSLDRGSKLRRTSPIAIVLLYSCCCFRVLPKGKEGKLPETKTGWTSRFHLKIEGEPPEAGQRPPASLSLPLTLRCRG
ncbi:retrovirus-related Pol polyprotein from transposon TNT 1-94 [Trichonephila clavipes]|nr:retrovirus-related Pol polyprotein from transposon TNT 1-94 [Trichonephila clavipes]